MRRTLNVIFNRQWWDLNCFLQKSILHAFNWVHFLIFAPVVLKNSISDNKVSQNKVSDTLLPDTEFSWTIETKIEKCTQSKAWKCFFEENVSGPITVGWKLHSDKIRKVFNHEKNIMEISQGQSKCQGQTCDIYDFWVLWLFYSRKGWEKAKKKHKKSLTSGSDLPSL